MAYNKRRLAEILETIDFGSSVAEKDDLLESARVETSVFTDLLNDKVDLIPGTKGSGKSALYRIFVDFLPDALLRYRKVVIAHGVQSHGDNLFRAFNKEFKKMREDEFVNFWCVYLISLANEQFVKNPVYAPCIGNCKEEIKAFRNACQRAHIPDFEKPKSLYEVLGWVLNVIARYAPRAKWDLPHQAGQLTFPIFDSPPKKTKHSGEQSNKAVLPQYIRNIKETLETVLKKANLNLWLMVDRLDEIFPRRSRVETLALRGLLRILRIFESPEIRVKVFLRDDILDQVTSGGQGFTALTHTIARSADTLCWSKEQILVMIVKRLFTNTDLTEYLGIDTERLSASHKYRIETFYKVFPPTVHRGAKQSSTLKWIYNHTMDGNRVVTPRDVITLLTKAKQKQQDEISTDLSGNIPYIIGPTAIIYGLTELSKEKRRTFLQAEFPHLWKHINKLVGGRTEYTQRSIRKLYGAKWAEITDDLCAIGVMRKEQKRTTAVNTFKIPFLYREGLELTQGRA